MSSLSKELVFLVLQFLNEENLKETIHQLQKESGHFFDLKYFEEKVMNGEWEVAESYLSGFTKMIDNRYSMKMYFEMRKQKYLEALDRKEKTRALEILGKDLKVFQTYNEDLYKEMTYLLTLESFRDNEQLSKYGDIKASRKTMTVEIKKLIEANPLLNDKIVFPSLKPSRLRTLINQSLNWQHQLCKNPKSHPDIRTLFVDHSCSTSTPAAGTSSAAAKPPPPPPHLPPPPPPSIPIPTPTPSVNPFFSMMNNANGASTSSAAPAAPQNQSLLSALKHPRTPSTPGFLDSPNNDEQLAKRLRSAASHSLPELLRRAINLPVAPPQQAPPRSLDDLTRTVYCTLIQGSTVTSMDFHPSLHSLLLVGTVTGEISFWEVGRRERPITKPFSIWNSATCSVLFQAAYAKDSTISISRVSWSADGRYLGVAFTKHLVHVYVYQAPNELKEHMEVDAHVGSVNDLAFSSPSKQLTVVTCGDDKLIKVWDLTGRNLFSFEGHQAAVYSICLNMRENTEYIFSSSVDGKIKAWLFDNSGSKLDHNANGKWCTTMLYSSDGNRMFSCGTTQTGSSFLVEWEEYTGTVKRIYSGFGKKAIGIMQFDTAKNRYLAAGEDRQLKFWDMDNTNILATVDVDDNLSSVPRVRFNKVGNLLAVTTVHGRVKILANADGIKHLRAIQAWAFRASLKSNTNLELGGSSSTRRSNKPSVDLPEILQCQVLTLTESMYPSAKVGGLAYMKTGNGILAVGSDGSQKLWRWIRTESNPLGKATTSASPPLWRPTSGFVMTNDVPENPEAVSPCAIVSRNDSYALSTCGGKVTLFNMLTFSTMVSFMSPPPHSTCLAFHPQDNNIVAIGKDDSSIHLYNVQSDQIKVKLTGHEKRITGLAFSTLLNVLVSSSADGQLVFWSMDTWKERKSMKICSLEEHPLTGDIRVQFHSNELHLLVCHPQVIRIYDALRRELIRQWVPQPDLFGSISCATYSCNSKLIYAALTDGNILIFNAATLVMRCRIAPSVYLMSHNSLDSQNVYPVSVAANPVQPDQFAVGLSNGDVKVIEPKHYHQGNNNGLNIGGWVATFRSVAEKTPRNQRRRACSSGMVEVTLSDTNSGANTI
ncbi:hypothetical protein PIB30_035730 [Stylosanthes scabra]|uniref:CTLH domain-containing protein n=1 Tax=Stylosanthes scabra TaxID=79078 RepID=A0ABU6ZBK4_9FABA|nr:hypothetical protein [Stylosanthes scabra]